MELLVATMMAVVWLGFGIALVAAPARLSLVWHAVRRSSPLVQLIAWILLLPWMIGLALWESGWSPFMRRCLIAVFAVSCCIVVYQSMV